MVELGNTRERQTKRSQQAAADAATMQAREAELQERFTEELNRELHVLDLFAGLKCAWGLSLCLSLASHIRLALLRSMASAFEATCPYALKGKLKVTTLDDDSALRYEGEPRPEIHSFDADIKEDILDWDFRRFIRKHGAMPVRVRVARIALRIRRLRSTHTGARTGPP